MDEPKRGGPQSDDPFASSPPSPPGAPEPEDGAAAPTEPLGAGKLRGLARMIAKAGWATRTQAETLVRAGRVRVEGIIERDPHRGLPASADIRMDGLRITDAPRHYFAWHKPPHLPAGPSERLRRRTVGNNFPPGVPGLRPAGRLDAETTGLVLVSNDAGWNDKAAGGAGFEKEYIVRIAGSFSELEFDLVSAGMHIPKLGFVRPVAVRIEEAGDNTTVLRLALVEGKNRQVRRIFGTLRHEILSLHRVRIGPVSLGDLEAGQSRPLTPAEVDQIGRGDPRPRRGSGRGGS